MKQLVAILIFLSAVNFTYGQSNESSVNAENTEYLEWASNNGYKFMTDVKEEQPALDGSEILDASGISLAENFSPSSFDITKYDFDTVIAPEKNTMIKVSDEMYIFIKSRHRQEVLFERYLINKAAKK